MGDDQGPSYEDTCNFRCNTGYELTGSDTRTCQRDGRWSGSDAVCGIGKFYLYTLMNYGTAQRQCRSHLLSIIHVVFKLIE